MNGFVYLQTEPGLFTTGFYDPAGLWHADNDYDNKSDAMARCCELNGGTKTTAPTEVESLRDRFAIAALATMVLSRHSVRDCQGKSEAAYRYADAMLKARKVGGTDAE